MNTETAPYRFTGPSRFAHQREGLRRLVQQRGVGALLMDPGLGKTATVVDYLGLLAHKSGDEVRVLVVAPLAAVDTWVTQLDTFLGPSVNYWAEVLGGSILQRAEALASRGGNPFKRSQSGKVPRRAPHSRGLWVDKAQMLRTRGADVENPQTPAQLPRGPRLVLEVVNIDTLSRRTQHRSRTVADLLLEAVERYDPHVVVCDELHMIKSPSSNTSRLMGRIAKVAPRRIGLTGTVMPTSPLDVFGQWRFIDPYAFGVRGKAASYTNFLHRFAQMGGFMGREVVGFRNLDELQDIMGKLAMVARKEDALDLPPTTDVVIPVNLSPAEVKAYAEMKKGLATTLATGDTATATTMLVQGLRLRQITAGHLKADDGVVTTVGTSKADTIRSLVHDTLGEEKRLVIFALYRAEMEQLATSLARKGTEVMVIDGSTPNHERIEMRKRFGSDDPARIVMVAQVRTMSLAVNELVTASHAIFATLSQQRDHYVQARDRLNRIGQERPVTFWHAVAPGTVDEVVLTAHRDRTSLEEAVLRHVRGDEDPGPSAQQVLTDLAVQRITGKA